MTNIKQAYTPRKIVDSGLFFSIPLYQRLFEWGEDQIIQLLDDLYSSYKRDKNLHITLECLQSKELKAV